jgi:hypothetical protein
VRTVEATTGFLVMRRSGDRRRGSAPDDELQYGHASSSVQFKGALGGTGGARPSRISCGSMHIIVREVIDSALAQVT